MSFLLWFNLFILSVAISNCPLLLPSNILDTFWPVEGSSSSVKSICLFILFIEFSQQEFWSGLPFLPPVDHILSELFTVTHPSCMALNDMTHSFIELCKPLSHDKAVIREGLSVESAIFEFVFDYLPKGLFWGKASFTALNALVVLV